jgi:hypothetical protein
MSSITARLRRKTDRSFAIERFTEDPRTLAGVLTCRVLETCMEASEQS